MKKAKRPKRGRPAGRETHFKILVDTCVWLDLVKNHQELPILGALEDFIQQKKVSLIVPRTIVEEFARNKAKVIDETRQSLSTVLKRVKDVVDKFGDPDQKGMVLEHLNDVDHKLPLLGQNAVGSVTRIERLFKNSTIMETSDAVKLRASQRAIDGRAPFHKQKNSINDAILIETFAEVAGDPSAAGTRFMFVTHNIKDFSTATGNTKHPHPDIAPTFSRIKAQYFTRLIDALRRVEPELLSEIIFENTWEQEPRRLAEILEAMDLLTNQIWYNRHHNLRYRVKTGKTVIVEKETYPRKGRRDTIQRDVWQGALNSATKLEKRLGLENLGPWTDFEWGMLNGKLSALRWMLGDEWDMLDT